MKKQFNDIYQGRIRRNDSIFQGRFQCANNHPENPRKINIFLENLFSGKIFSPDFFFQAKTKGGKIWLNPSDLNSGWLTACVSIGTMGTDKNFGQNYGDQ